MKLSDIKTPKWQRHGIPLEQRFWSKVNKTGDCWKWVAGINCRGYGKFSVGSRSDGSRREILAPRMSWLLTYGEIPEGIFVCHHCDNPLCVNPEHLFLGSPKDNQIDSVTKNRRPDVSGAKHPQTRLTQEQVNKIRERRKNGEKLQAIAEDYGVTFSNISAIALFKSWR